MLDHCVQLRHKAQEPVDFRGYPSAVLVFLGVVDKSHIHGGHALSVHDCLVSFLESLHYIGLQRAQIFLDQFELFRD